jgi:TrmH family RNA methyltransferase
MQNRSFLHNVSIILVETKTPANIGSVARCMKNTGLSRLILVDPPNDRNGDASRLAAGASDILAAAEIYHSLDEALADHHLVIGTTRHKGKQRKNIRSPHVQAAQAVPLLVHSKVAVMFGNEVNGLTTNELARCHELIAIPSADAFPSLNLSHAVMVVAYELFLAAEAAPLSAQPALAAGADTEHFYRHLQQTLQNIEFLTPSQSDRMMRSLRHLFGKARLDDRDIKILQGILTSVDRAAHRDTKISNRPGAARNEDA